MSDDDWGFLDKRRKDPRPDPGATEPAAPVPPRPRITPKLNQPAEPAPTPTSESQPTVPTITPKAARTGESAGRAHGEFRAEMTAVPLRKRALPIALSLAAVSVAGLLTEVVAASQMLTLLGPDILLLMYPLGGLGLLAIALLQTRYVDHAARLPMLRWVSLGYAIAFAVALVLLVGSVWPAAAVGLVWLMADQLNFLVPLLLWSLAGDEFNVAEGRKVFGWIITWTYAGQILGLVIATVSPPLLAGVDAPLTWLLIIDPIVCLALAIWLPRAMRNSAAARGAEREQRTVEAIRSATEFVWAIPAWRAFLIGSLLTFMAGMTLYLGYSALAERLIPDDAGALQMYLGGVGLACFAICWLIQATLAEKMQERLGIPGILLILPVTTVVGGLLLLLATGSSSLLLAAVGVAMWLIPRWSIDENARRGALSLVPDERRARVSFLVDLLPMAVGLIASAPLAFVAIVTGQYWIAFVVALILSLAAIPFALRTRRTWDESMLNWRLRRRKRNRTADFGLEDS